MTGSTPQSSKQAPPPDRRGAFSLLFGSLLAIGAGNTMLIAAVLPIMTRELGMQDWMAGAIFSLSAALWTMSSPFWGKKSSQWGRRPVAALGLAGYSLSMLLFGTVGWLALNDYLTGAFVIFGCLLFSRSFFGLVGSGASPAAQAYVADRTSPEDRTKEIASVTSGFSVGAVAGPAFAAAMVAVFGLLSPVFFTCILAAVMSFLLYTKLPEDRPPTSTPAQKKASAEEAKGLWRDRRVLPFLIYAVGLSLVTGVLTQTFIFAVIDKMGVSGEAAAQFTAPAFMAGAVGTLIAQLVIIPRLRISNRSLMIVGALTLAAGALMIFPTDAFAVLVSAQFLVGLGQGLSRPGFSSGASLAVGPHLQGNVAGLVISANGMGFIVSPFFGPYVYEFIGQSLPFIMAAVVLVALAVFARFALPDSQPSDSDLQGDIK
ncbi:MAG: MFS transporter [Hyphomonadaceae bacterium]